MSKKERITLSINKNVLELFKEKIKEEPGKNCKNYSNNVEKLMELYIEQGPPILNSETSPTSNFSEKRCRWTFSQNWGSKLEEDFKNLKEKYSRGELPMEVRENELRDSIDYGWRTVKNHISKMRKEGFIDGERETEFGTIYKLDSDMVESFLDWRDKKC